MSKTIHYADVYSLNSTLIRQSDIVGNGYVYQQCPAFKHRNERIFIGTSPIDLCFSIQKTSEGPIIEVEDDDMIEYIDIDHQHINSPKPVFQLYVPKFLFWTHDSDVWIEQNDHPMTSLNNNVIAVPAWFNLSNWSRTISVAFTLVNETKSVIIRKNDPLFRISFYSDNLNDDIFLKQEEYRDEYQETVEKDLYARRDVDGYSKNLFSKTNKVGKCPFSSLF